MKILALIPARGNSKGVPGKNIKDLAGKPLIAYTIEAALKSGVLDRVVLSTDNQEIAKIGKNYGAEVLFMQPAYLAKDDTPMLDVVKYTLKWLKGNENYIPTHVMILQPTTPFRQVFHIVKAARLINDLDGDSVMSVIEIPTVYNPSKAMVLNERGTLELFNGEPVRKRVSLRQNVKKAYCSVGMIFLFKTPLIFDPAEPSFYGERVIPYIIEDKYTIDIDTQADWKKAEEMFSTLN